jgi:hypothetical protein
MESPFINKTVVGRFASGEDMRITKSLAFVLFLALYADTQDVPRAVPRQKSRHPKPQTHAQCKFSDGKTITATYSSGDVRTIAFVTDQNLVTLKDINVPAGDYMISAVTDFHDNWTLIMRQQNDQSKYLELPAKSVRKLASPDEAVAISFNQSAGSCSMHWNLETSNILITLAFTEKNVDSHVLR